MSEPALQTLYRDAELLVVAKPAGRPLFADRTGGVPLWPEIAALAAPATARPVHRLDKGTSGVLVVALDDGAQRRLNRAFAAHAVRKYYWARVAGDLDLAGTGSIDLPLMRGRKSRYRVAGQRASIIRVAGPAAGTAWRLGVPPHPDGIAASTRVRVLGRADGRTTVLLQPRTGRTHQLRVHLAWIGHALCGDHLYGRGDDPAQQADRLMLHCHRIIVPDGHGGWLGVRSPVPAGPAAGPGAANRTADVSAG